MDTIRIGLVGLGHRGLAWLRHLKRLEGYDVTAVYDPIVALHAPALETLEDPAVTTYTRYDEMLADPKVEAVAVTVRSLEQGAVAAQALEAGKHVNAEVPAAHTLEDCWRIVLAVERSGLVYQLADQARYWGFIDAWHDLVSQERLGRITYCEGQYIGYYGTRQFFQDIETGRFYSVEELKEHSEAQPTCLHRMPPIHYLPHELSPMLKVLDDRVVEVTAMSTIAPSYSHPEIDQPDVQVALMKTEKDTLLRMATGFTQPVSHPRGHHWYQLIGTRGCVEWKRSGKGKALVWFADSDSEDMVETDWDYRRPDAPNEARDSGHGDADYYVRAAFRDAVLGTRSPEFNFYQAMDTAAPAILAADSIEQGTKLMRVPDFRPGTGRAVKEEPVDYTERPESPRAKASGSP